MARTPLLAVLFVLLTAPLPAISVYQVKVPSQADVLVYQVDHDYQADLIVYNSSFASDGGPGQPYVWYYTPLATLAKVKLYSVTYAGQADLLIYFTDKPYKVGWVNNAKKLLWSGKFEGS